MSKFNYDEDTFVPSRNESAAAKDRVPLISNHTGYQGIGTESWEHDDTGHIQNYSGCFDDMMDPIAEHEGWVAGYDY
jgi:hypothetical protein